jgi:hypothetical protein
VSPELAAICMHCLQKRPEDRYASAGELASDLERVLHDYAPIHAHGTRWPQRGVLWWRRNRVVAGLSAVIVLLSAAVLGAWMSGVLPPEGPAAGSRSSITLDDRKAPVGPPGAGLPANVRVAVADAPAIAGAVQQPAADAGGDTPEEPAGHERITAVEEAASATPVPVPPASPGNPASDNADGVYRLTVVNGVNEPVYLSLNGKPVSEPPVTAGGSQVLTFRATGGVSLGVKGAETGKSTSRGVGRSYTRTYTVTYGRRGSFALK